MGYPENHPLFGYPGPDPRTVALGLPIGDFKPDWAYVTGILQCFPFFARPITYAGCSMVMEARNLIAHKFLHKYEPELEWLVWIDSDIGFTPTDWCLLMGNDDPLVVAPYSKKNFEGVAVTTGFGFVKVHRRVFEAIANLLTEDGAERVPRFFHPGEPGQILIDYFPAGATASGQWIGEDQGFLNWAAIAGYTYRNEWRCDLTHYGRHGYKLGLEHPT